MMEMKRINELLPDTLERLSEEVEALIERPESDNLHWRGSRLDLMEALYEVYLLGRLTDAAGSPLSFARLVRMACAVLHTRVPSNPYDCAARGRSRKGLLQHTYLDRYGYLLHVKGKEQPLWEEIEILNTEIQRHRE